MSWFEVVSQRQQQSQHYWDLAARSTAVYAETMERIREDRLELLATKPVVAALRDMGDMADLIWRRR